jgi:hypothetical protein
VGTSFYSGLARAYPTLLRWRGPLRFCNVSYEGIEKKFLINR